ncbi:hypothetical protein DM52_2870 [Burkholderia mallei]|nr:hypothetical protein DM52_2870 [Burkholderia mallei]
MRRRVRRAADGGRLHGRRPRQAVREDRRQVARVVRGVHRGRGGRRLQHDRRDRRHHRAARRSILLPAARHQGAADDRRGAQVHRGEPEARRLQREHGRVARARQGVSLPQLLIRAGRRPGAGAHSPRT